MLCCSAPPACSGTPLWPSVHYPSIRLVVNFMCFETFCDPTDLYRFDVRLELYGANARLVVGPPPLSPSLPPTLSPSRWSALIILPPLAKFQLIWRRLCEALLSSSSLDGQKHASLPSRLCLKCRRCKFALNMIESSIIFADTMDVQRRLRFEHDHCRRAD